MTTSSLLIRTPDLITAEWLGAALGTPVADVVSTERIGTGQMSQNHRVRYTTADGGQASVVVKLASDNETSRATGFGMGAYYREVAFYSELAGRLGGPVPTCHLAEYEETQGWFTLVLEDIAGGVQGDQIAGCTVEEARIALVELARLHAPVLNDLAVGTSPFLNQPNPLGQTLLAALLDGFLDRYADRVDPRHADVCRAFVAVTDAWLADRRAPLGLVHGDYRLDNLLFTPEGCVVVDWQTVSWGPVMTDAAYFLGGALTPEDRRAHEQDLVRAYHDELLARGVQNFGWDLCWDEYRRQTFLGLVMTIAPAMVVERTDRGDDMFMAWLQRACEQILDLDALALLPEPGARPEPLRPQESDEGLHEPGAEPLWNESWYFDAVDPSGELGVYVRLGRLPNQGNALYTAAVVRPGQPALMVVDAAAPLPAEDDPTQQVATATITASQDCVRPLQEFRVRLTGTAQAHADHAAPLLAGTGEPEQVSLDLTWHTDGIPYAWRHSTRYEIPCRVTGTVRIGECEYAVDAVGQRDHSWGARDWWANDWMWSAFHLSDGTRTHAVTVPELPGFAVGYTQNGDELVELESGTSTAEVAGDGLVTAATVVTGPGELSLDVRPLAFGALRLVAPDGRVTHFPRAMARVTAADGRTGVGWIEWNRNQR